MNGNVLQRYAMKNSQMTATMLTKFFLKLMAGNDSPLLDLELLSAQTTVSPSVVCTLTVFTRIFKFNLADFSDQTALSLISLTAGLFECILFLASLIVLPGKNNIMYQFLFHMKLMHHSIFSL